MKVSPWPLVGLLLLLQTGLAWYGLLQHREETVVFTPLVDVVADGVPLTGSEANALLAGAHNAAEARDIQQAYARLGSTFSLDDLLRGVEGLDDLDSAQKKEIGAILAEARASHQEVMQVQTRILDLERQLDLQLSEIQPQLPPGTLKPVGGAPANAPGPVGPPGPPAGGPP